MTPAAELAQRMEDLGEGHMPISCHPQFAPTGQLQLLAFVIETES